MALSPTTSRAPAFPFDLVGAGTELVFNGTDGSLVITGRGANQGQLFVSEEASGSFVELKSRSLLLSGAATEVKVDDGGGTTKTLADQSKLLIGYTAAPADAQLSNGQLAFWFDLAPPGALKIKARDSGATIRTATVVLA